MLGLSDGALHCLPYSRALLDFFEARGKTAVPLVVRCVVFGRLDPATLWNQLDVRGMIKTVIHGPAANASIVTKFTPEGSTEFEELTVPYRTLGFPHSGANGNNTLGNYEDGTWLGHLVVLADNTVIDLTIGQLNSEEYAILLDPPYVTIEADELFLSGKAPLIGQQDGILVCYYAFPDERTHEKSDSWTKLEFREQLRTVGERVAKSFEGNSDDEFHKRGA